MDAHLFDLDGTLIDSFEDIALSANHVREVLGLPPKPAAEIFSYVGEGAQRLLERTLGTTEPEMIAKALAIWRDHYSEHCLDHTKPYAGIVEALATLPGVKAIVTNKPGPAARHLVEALGLGPWVGCVVGGGDVERRKPDAEGCRLALSKLPKVDRVVFVGDSVVDAKTALAAGYAFVGVLWGMGQRAELEALGAHFFARSAGELPMACAAALDQLKAQ